MAKEGFDMTPNAYRPDIDGLRAIAVLAVIFYHLGWSPFSGGFVGVDVFLVISGYLITGIIRRQLDAGSFSFRAFYLRRIKRLLPALVVVVALCFIPAYLWLPPPALEHFAGSALSAIFSVSNLFFWNGSGYFAADALSLPLLHTWSLSVEEQFYLVWPFVVCMLMPLSRQAGRRVMLLILVVSLAAAELMVRHNAATAFFWMPFRVAEFAVGAWLAWSALPAVSKRLADMAVALGLISIAVAVFFYESTMRFPGVSAMLPVLGAGAVIALGHQSTLGHWLGHRYAVRIGLLAYALYLVHWPLIVFASYVLERITLLDEVVMLFATFVGAYGLHRYVETPMRYMSWSSALGATRFALFALGTVSLVVTASLAWSQNGWGFRYADELRGSIRDMASQRASYWQSARDKNKQFEGDGHAVAVVGNSFAVDVYYALRRQDRLDVVLSHNSYYFCYGLRKPYQPDHMARHGEHCHDTFERIAHSDYIEQADTIVINERWRIQYGVDETLASLDDAIGALRQQNPDANVVLIGPRMTFSGRPRNVYEKVIRYGQLDGAREYVADDYAFSLEALTAFDQGLAAYADEQSFDYISLREMLCDDRYCDILTAEQENLYWDEGHLSRSGAGDLHRRLAQYGIYQDVFGL